LSITSPSRCLVPIRSRPTRCRCCRSELGSLAVAKALAGQGCLVAV